MLAKEIVAFSNMDKETLEQMGNNGRQYVSEKMNFSYLGKKLLQFIDEVG